MKFNSQICTTREQSERLPALGLKKETADICLRPDNTLIPIHENCFVYHSLENAMQVGYCPAWSLHRLIEIAEVSVECSGLWVRISSTYRYEEKDNVFDNLIDAITDLISNNVFNKEYLE